MKALKRGLWKKKCTRVVECGLRSLHRKKKSSGDEVRKIALLRQKITVCYEKGRGLR